MIHDLTRPHCKTCGKPDYACTCEHPVMVPAAIKWLLHGNRIPKDHPFIVARTPKEDDDEFADVI